MERGDFFSENVENEKKYEETEIFSQNKTEMLNINLPPISNVQCSQKVVEAVRPHFFCV